LAEFRKCLATYTMHNLVTLFGPTQGVVRGLEVLYQIA